AFTLCLTSGLIPAEESVKPLRAFVGEEGQIWVESRYKLPRKAAKELTQAGVIEGDAVEGDWQAYENWLQVLPLARTAGQLETSDKTVVLFDVQREGQLAEIVAEVLRLGNDRQSFRQLASDDAKRTLLRVVGPPYYALLRAAEDQPTDPSKAADNKDFY